MATFKATKNASTTQSNSKNTFKATRNAGYDRNYVYNLQYSNKSALDIINEYNKKVQNGEWLSQDDRTRYQSAVETYAQTGANLRGVSRYYGTNYTLDEEKGWWDTVSSLKQGYTSIDDFYKQFGDENQYKGWQDRENQRNEYRSVLTAPDYTGKNDFRLWQTVNVNDPNKNRAIKVNELRQKYMTDEDWSIVTYYANKGDMSKASEYLAFKDDEFAAKESGRLAEKYDDSFMEWVFSVNAGIEQFSTGIQNVGKAVWGEDPVQNSVYQNASYIMGENNTGFWKGFNDLSQTVANQVPSLLADAFAPGVGRVTNSLSASGNAYSEIYNTYGKNSARAYGVMVFASEFLLGKALGGIPGLGGGDGVFQKIAGKILPGINNAAARVAIQIGGNMLDEALEEGVQTALEPVFKWAATLGEAELEKVNWEEIGYSALLGGLSAGVFGGVSTIPNSVSVTQRAQKAYGGDASTIVADALNVDPKNKTAQMAQTRLDKGKGVSGLALNEIVNSTDRTKVKSAIESRLTELGETGDTTALSNAIAKQVAGEELSSKESKLLKNSQNAQRVLSELNPKNIASGQYTSDWAEGIGTKKVNADVYNLRERVDTPTEQNATQDVSKPSGAVQNKPYESASTDLIEEAAQDKMSKVPGFTEEAANVMRKGYDGRMLPSEYIRTFDEAYNLGLNGAQATSVVNLAHDTEGINQSTLLAAYDLGRQAKEKSVSKTPTESDIINTESEALTNEVTSEVTSEGAGIHLRRGSEWNDGSYPQEQVSGLDSRPGTNQTRGEGSRPADGEAVNLVNEGREVIVAELGILNGSKTQTVRLVDANKETTAMKKARKDAESRGLKIKFFVGDNIAITEKTGEISAVRAYVLGDTMLVRADHPVYTADQLERHEAGHVRIERGEINQKDVRKRLEEIVGKEAVENVAEAYADLYAGTGMTAEEIWEECICDFLGDINIFSKSANGSLVVNELINQTQEITKEQKAEPNQTRGSPEATQPDGKASRELDTLGNELTEEQAEFFKDSKVRDDEGNLKVMYHGSSESFTVFDKNRINASSWFGEGFYFTENKDEADFYGDNIIEAYLNVENPYIPTADKILEDGTVEFAPSFIDDLKNRFNEIKSIKNPTAAQITDVLQSKKYDGIIIGENVVIFESNQAKLTTNENPASNPDIRYSREPFSRQVDDVLNGSDTSNTHLKIMDTPKLLQDAGLPNLPILMTAKHLKTITQAKGKDRANYHGLDVKIIKNLPKHINDPVMIADSLTRDDSIVIITEVIDKENRPVIVAIMLNGKGNIDGKYIDANIMTSAYGRNNFQNFINNIANENAVIYWNKNKSQELSVNLGIQFPNIITRLDSNTIIRKARAFVNTNFKNNFEGKASRELDALDYITHDEELEAVNEMAFSNRTLLANALLDTITSSEEYKLVRSYQEEIAKLDAGDKRLAQLKKDLNQLYNQEKPNLEVIRELREKITALESEIVNRDKRLLRLESTTALKNVLERARKDAYAKAMQKGKETMHRAVESRHKTIERNKAKKTAHELEMLLNKNDKKRNVKLGEQAIVRAALDLSDMYFTSDDELIMNGIQTPALDRENDALAQYRALYDRLHATDHDVTNHKEERAQLRHEMNEVKKGLKDLLERERRRINNTQASSVYDAVINEYRKLQASPDTYVSRAFDANVLAHLEKLKTDLGNKLVSEMTLEELKDVNNAFSMIKHMVVNSNKMFREGRSEDLQERSTRIMREISNVGKDNIKDRGKVAAFVAGIVDTAGWDNLRPVDAFELIGSEGLTDLFWDAISAQDVYARDIVEYNNALEKARRKYGYKNWEFKPVTTFKTYDGRELKLTLGDMMSIYAYSKRAQADKHLREGGIQFKKNAIYKDEKKAERVRSSEELTYKITDALRIEIISKLTQEQRAYVDDMQQLLTDWGQKGNEVTRVLYGIDLFNDEKYFPLRSSRDYISSMDTQLAQTLTTASLVGSGFAKSTTPNANNPIILDSFDNVVHDHIDRMSKYHAYVIPIENLRKILDTKVTDSGNNMLSLKSKIRKRLGEGAEKYLENYITDLNGSAHQDSSFAMKLFSKSKGAAVAANLSVWVQQYFSVIRAMNEINPTYFAPFMGESYKQPDMKLYEEMKKYAPITVIKEMGGFDVGAHGSVAQYVGFNEAGWSREKVSQKMQDAFGVGANVMDKLGWMTIWKAVKKEIAATNQYKLGSEEFYKACGKRMNEVITKTQVYDSVNARSGNMRSKSDLMKMATSFLGEPTTIMGMVEVAGTKVYRAIKRGDKKAIKEAWSKAGRVVATVAISTAMSSIFKSLIYAMRDDDEDETYFEKYAAALAGAFRDDINLFGYFPFARDIVSVIEGLTIERPDMTLIEDLVNATKRLVEKKDGDSTRVTFEEAINFIGTIGNLFGVPIKNIKRDLGGLYNTVTGIGRDYDTNLKNAIEEGLKGRDNTKSYNIYVAELRGDTNRINYYKSTYEDNSKYYSALRKAIRENDPRVETAAKARLEGDNDTYYNLMYDLIEEGHFDSDLIKEAFEAEYKYLKKKKEEAEGEE